MTTPTLGGWLVEVMRKAAEHFASGKLDRKLPVPESEELAALAVAMNDMAAELNAKIKTIRRQRNELEAVDSTVTGNSC